MTGKETEQIKFIDSRSIGMRLGLAAAVIISIVCGWFAVRGQIGNMLAEYTPPNAPNAERTAEYSVAFAPSDPMANWFSATLSRDIYDPEKSEIGLSRYEKVVALAPNDYRWWIELGRARDQAEDFAAAESAFIRATEIAPAYTFPHWQLGNFYLRRGETEKAFAELRRAADSSSKYRLQVFSTVWDYYDQDPKMIEQVAGDAQTIRADLALFYAARERADDSLRIWQTLSPETRAENDATGKTIALALFVKKFFRAAQGFAASVGIDAESKPETLQNGGFENLLNREDNSYFNWKILSAEKVDVRSDTTQKAEGARSLRIVFNGYTEPTYYNIYQIVTVEAGAKYSLSFAYETEDLKSAGNPYIEIINANDDKQITATKPFESGSTANWQRGEITFTAPPNAQAVTIRVSRVCTAQCPLFGTLRLDDFKLSRR